MNLTTLFATLSILLIAFPAYGAPDLEDWWCISMSTADSGTTHDQGQLGSFIEEFEEMKIEKQVDYTYGTLFYGYVPVVDGEGNPENGYFSGVLDNKTISLTHWDSVTRGTLIEKGNKPLEIHFINNAFFESNLSGKTAVGVAVQVKCSDIVDCYTLDEHNCKNMMHCEWFVSSCQSSGYVY